MPIVALSACYCGSTALFFHRFSWLFGEKSVATILYFPYSNPKLPDILSFIQITNISRICVELQACLQRSQARKHVCKNLSQTIVEFSYANNLSTPLPFGEGLGVRPPFSSLPNNIDNHRCANQWSYGIERQDALRTRQHANKLAQKSNQRPHGHGDGKQLKMVVGANHKTR